LNFRLIRSVLSKILILYLLLGAVNAAGSERLVSVIMTGDLERYNGVQQAFLEHVTSTDVKVYTQTPNPDPLSLANSIRKVVALNTDLIVTYGAQAAMAARKEAPPIPVLFADVYDPVGLGLVECSQERDCDMSGISATTPMKTLLKTLSDLKPKNRTLALLFSSNDPGSVLQCKALKSLADGEGFEVQDFDLKSKAQVDAALAELSARDCILFVSESALVQKYVDRVLKMARHYDLLVFSQVPGLCDKGALLTLEPEVAEQGVRLADYVNRFLDGTPIDALPVVTPHRVDLVLNLGVAKKHHLAVTLQTLTRATRIVK